MTHFTKIKLQFNNSNAKVKLMVTNSKNRYDEINELLSSVSAKNHFVVGMN